MFSVVDAVLHQSTAIPESGSRSAEVWTYFEEGAARSPACRDRTVVATIRNEDRSCSRRSAPIRFGSGTLITGGRRTGTLSVRRAVAGDLLESFRPRHCSAGCSRDDDATSSTTASILISEQAVGRRFRHAIPR